MNTLLHDTWFDKNNDAGAIDAERRLLAAGWWNPSELARAADAFGLHGGDFLDRLCGVAVGYLCSCTANNCEPKLSEAAEHLPDLGIPNAIDELYFVLVETPLSPGDALPDLAQAVQQAADERSEADCRAVTREATLIVLHALACPRCRQCARAVQSSRATRTRTRLKRPQTRRTAPACV